MKSEAAILTDKIEAEKPDDDTKRQWFFARTIRAPKQPYFIVWWHTQEQEHGYNVTVIQEASVLMPDLSIFRVELVENNSAQKVAAYGPQAHNVKHFTQEALACDTASRCDPDYSFEGNWYSALDEAGPEWLSQMASEALMDMIGPAEQDQVATH